MKRVTIAQIKRAGGIERNGFHITFRDAPAGWDLILTNLSNGQVTTRYYTVRPDALDDIWSDVEKLTGWKNEEK